MRAGPGHWIYVVAAIAGLLAVSADTAAKADASGDTSLSYATLEPAHIRFGDSAVIRITSLYGRLDSVPPLPTVPGLTFEVLGREQGFEFGNGQSIPATYILIRVTPHSAGLFAIPALMPGFKPLLLEVLPANEPNPYAYRPKVFPQPLPVKPAPIPKGVQLKAGGAAFVVLVIRKRTLYVGESVPVDIEVGVRPGIVTSINGLPTLSSGDFTLNNLSPRPIRHEQLVEGNPFLVMIWHTVVAAVRPGDFSLVVQTPLSVRRMSSVENPLGWPLFQTLPKGAPRDVTVASPPAKLTVLPLPTAGQPQDFSGAVGDFQVSSDISPATAAVGEPQILRLHVSGAGNFDRVSSIMLQHLDHWRTYPVKSSFTPRNAVGYSGEKVFEQPLIALVAGQQLIPALELSYFNPETRQYERARTRPIKVTITALPGAALAGSSAVGDELAQGLRPDHPRPQGAGSDLEPLYFKGPFLALPVTLVLIFAGCWLAVRPHPVRIASKAADQALAELSAALRTGDSTSFFMVGRQRLLEAFAARWRVSADQVTAAQLKMRLGPAGEDIGRFLALAEEVKYADSKPGRADCQRWLMLIRSQLTGGGG